MADVDAAFALDELDQDSDDIAIARSDAFHGFEIVERHAHETRKQRLESGLNLPAAGRGECRDRAAVEGLVQHDDRRRFDAALVTVEPRELDRRLVRLAPGVAEEDALHTGDLGEPVGELFLKRYPVEVRRVHEPAQLLLEGRGELRMRVSQAAHRDAGKRIEVTSALGVP